MKRTERSFFGNVPFLATSLFWHNIYKRLCNIYILVFYRAKRSKVLKEALLFLLARFEKKQNVFAKNVRELKVIVLRAFMLSCLSVDLLKH